ncbi:MAG: DUF2079 domain-containing protein [Chloroflexota bacterium]
MNIQVERRYWRATVVLIAIYIAAFSVFTIGRYERYNATGFDLAFYDQILWRTVHTDVMGVSIEGNNVSNWAFHVEPILLLIAPFTLIFSDTRWLLILQTVALAIGAIPVYRIALRQWQKSWAGFVFAALYLFYPAVGWANKFDFHPITLVTPILLFAWDCAELKRYRWVSVLLLLSLLCKEEMGLVVAGLGLYWYFSSDPVDAANRWRLGLGWVVLGIVWALLGFFVIIPAAQSVSGLPSQAYLRYAWLFTGTLAEKIKYITGPDTPVKLRFLVQIFIPLLFTPLLKPRILAIASPIIALSLLSANLNQSGIYHQYLSDVVPFLMVAAIKGAYEVPALARRLKLRLRPIAVQRSVLAGMIAGTLAMFTLFNPFFFVPREPYAPIYGWESGASIEGLRAVEKMIPPESCLTASNNITARYGQRKYIYVFGIGNWSSCDLSLVDLADTRFVSFGVPHQFVCNQFAKENYHPIFYQDNVVLLKRDAPSTPAYDTQLAAYCAALPSNNQ